MDSETRVPGLAPARNRLGLTQVALAEMLGVHPITVARWETGERAPDIYTLKRLADALSTTVGALLDEPATAEGGGMKTRRLTAVGPDGQVYTRTTHRPYACVVVYQDGRRPTWHGSQELAQRKATNADTIVRCQEA